MARATIYFIQPGHLRPRPNGGCRRPHEPPLLRLPPRKISAGLWLLLRLPSSRTAAAVLSTACVGATLIFRSSHGGYKVLIYFDKF